MSNDWRGIITRLQVQQAEHGNLGPYILYLSPQQYTQLRQEILPYCTEHTGHRGDSLRIDRTTVRVSPFIGDNPYLISEELLKMEEDVCQAEAEDLGPYADCNLDELINLSLNFRDEAREYERLRKESDAKKKEVDAQILRLMEAQGVDRTGNDRANLSRTVKRVANVADWDAFYQYIHSNEAYHLLQRRVSQRAATDEEALVGEIPGLTHYEEAQLSIRAR